MCPGDEMRVLVATPGPASCDRRQADPQLRTWLSLWGGTEGGGDGAWVLSGAVVENRHSVGLGLEWGTEGGTGWRTEGVGGLGTETYEGVAGAGGGVRSLN